MKSRRPTTVLWVEPGPHTDAAATRGRRYWEAAGKSYRQRPDAEAHADHLRKRGYLEAKVVTGTVTWEDEE